MHEIRINHFLKVETPSDQYLDEFERRLHKFHEVLEGGQIFAGVSVKSEDIDFLSHSLIENQNLEAMERGVAALVAFHGRSEEPVYHEATTEEESLNELNVFTKLRLTAINSSDLLTDDMDRFSQPLLMRNTIGPEINTIEALSGREDKYAASIAAEILKDMRLATFYPPEHRDKLSAAELAAIVRELSESLVEARQKAT